MTTTNGRHVHAIGTHALVRNELAIAKQFAATKCLVYRLYLFTEKKILDPQRRLGNNGVFSMHTYMRRQARVNAYIHAQTGKGKCIHTCADRQGYTHTYMCRQARVHAYIRVHTGKDATQIHATYLGNTCIHAYADR